jgi:hypothetical protein
MNTTNTFHKYCPNVFVAKCPEKQTKGAIIVLTTKYGKEIESEVHNFLGQTKDGFYLYSITRCDGFNSQERAKIKAGKLEGYADNAEARSTKYYEASQEGRDFLALGEPIKIGHHSERRHRKLIERNWERMGKSVAESEKAKEYQRRAEYWADKANKIDLSMPDSLEFFEYELMKAKEKHQLLKDKPEARNHSMSLQYANKTVKDLEAKVYTAIILWGDEEDIKQVQKEKQEAAQTKHSKSKRKEDIIKKYFGFFAFNNDQFKEGYQATKEAASLNEGEKVTHIGMGLYVPSRYVNDFLTEYRK